MSLLFLIPLTIGLAVSYLFKNSTDDMAELTSLSTVACLIVSLIAMAKSSQLIFG